MQVYWASVFLIVVVLVFGFFLLVLDDDGSGDAYPAKIICLVCVILSAVALGVRIGEGVF